MVGGGVGEEGLLHARYEAHRKPQAPAQTPAL